MDRDAWECETGLALLFHVYGRASGRGVNQGGRANGSKVEESAAFKVIDSVGASAFDLDIRAVGIQMGDKAA